MANNILSGDNGLLSNEGITPDSGLPGLGSLLSIGKLGFGALQGDAGSALSGGLGLLGGAIGGPLGGIVGSLLGSFGSSLFGGGGARDIPLPARSIDQGSMSNFVKGLEGAEAGVGNLHRFRLSGDLHLQMKEVKGDLDFMIGLHNKLGFTGTADDLKTARISLDNIPSSPADLVNMIDFGFEAINAGANHVEITLDEMNKAFGNDPTLFEELSVPLPDIIAQVDREFERMTGMHNERTFDRVFREKEREVLATTPTHGSRTAGKTQIEEFLTNDPSLKGFRPEKAWGRNANNFTGFMIRDIKGPGRNNWTRERISTDEFNSLKAELETQFLNDVGHTRAREVLDNTRRQIALPDLTDLSNLGTSLVDVNSLFDSGDVQAPDFLPPGADVNTNKLLTSEESEAALLTAQEQFQSIQNDNTLSQEEKDSAQSQFNLDIAKFLRGPVVESGGDLLKKAVDVSGEDLNINLDLGGAPGFSLQGLLSGQPNIPQSGRGILTVAPPFERTQPISTRPDAEIERAPLRASRFPSQGLGILSGFR